jgi:hypothetical protein
MTVADVIFVVDDALIRTHTQLFQDSDILLPVISIQLSLVGLSNRQAEE